MYKEKNVLQMKVPKHIIFSVIVLMGTFFHYSVVLGADLTLKNPLGITDIPTFIGRVISAVLGIVGSLALVMFVYGGLLWMLSGGSPDRIKKGKDVFVWSTLGLVMIFGSYLIVKFIFTSLMA